MTYIWLGIKDYCEDVWHDWLLYRLQAVYPNATIYFYDHGYDADIETSLSKEGNLWHYIHQRKLSRKPTTREWVLEEYIKTKQDFIYYVWAALDEIASNGATYEWFVQECNYLCNIAKKRGWLK